MIGRIACYNAQGTDPYVNIAIEEELLELVQPGECILYLWQNKNTVVIGRNQNCRRECKVELLEAEGGHLARRLSGGGAVYHDLGNLNFTFLVQKPDYDLEKQTEVLLRAARLMGVHAQRSGRNDITVADRKFSGNAYYSGGQRCYHHGTLLVNSDMGRLAYYLNADPQKLESHGVQSVRSRVVNLAELVPGLSIETARQAMLAAFAEVYGLPMHALDTNRLDITRLEQRRVRFASWEWRMGAEPDFTSRLQHRFSWGSAQLGLTISGGFITGAVLYTDALDETLSQAVADCLCGTAFTRDAVCAAWAADAKKSPAFADLAMLTEEFFV